VYVLSHSQQVISAPANPDFMEIFARYVLQQQRALILKNLGKGKMISVVKT